MEKYLISFLIISLSSCNGGRLSGLLNGVHQQVHNQVHGVADVVIEGLNFLNGHQHQRQPVQQPSSQGGETIVVIVEEAIDGSNANRKPYGSPQQGSNYPRPLPNGYNQGYNFNIGYNQGNQDGNNHGHTHNQGYNSRPNYPANPGQGPYLNSNMGQHYGYGNGQQQNVPGYPNPQGQYNNGQGQIQNNHHNVNPYPTGNPALINSNPTTNEVKNPEQKPASNYNYKPTETYNDDGHQADNSHKNNENTSKKPDDGPLFVPINEYNYGGDKITINAPKRETDVSDNTKKTEETEEEFPIDIRFKDE